VNKLIGALCTLFVAGAGAAAQSPQSVYTDISAKACKTIRVDKESGASVQRCTGVGGYNLLVADDDSRMSITVVAPDGKKADLNYWSVITTAFSSLGSRAEWRVVKKNGKPVPLALIVRVNATEDPDNPNKVTPYLAVSKITSQAICVTDKINPGATQNVDARRAADSAASRACLQQ
jgi:hypothetical protein